MSILHELSESKRAVLAIRKIRPQFPVDKPEGKLMFAIVESAIRDAFGIRKIEIRSGNLYIRSSMPHAQICGVDPDWIRSVLKKLNLI